MLENGFQSAVVLGAGSWGTALALLLAERGVQVQLWGRDTALMEAIRLTRRNERYLPEGELPEAVGRRRIWRRWSLRKWCFLSRHHDIWPVWPLR